MKYQRIHILGGLGSGKTTLAACLAQSRNIDRTDLDDLFWDNQAATYNTRRDTNQRDQMLRDVVAQDQWIIEGVYHAWLAPSFNRAEFIVILNPPTWVRHWRIIRRFLFRKLGIEKNRKHESLKNLWDLLKWNHAYEKDNLTRAKEYLGTYRHKVLEFCAVSDALRTLS